MVHFGSPPATSTIMKTLRKIGPRRLPGLAQRPAAGALLPRATRSKGGEGRAQIIPRERKERERERKETKKRAQCPGPGAMPRPSNPLSSRRCSPAVGTGEGNLELPLMHLRGLPSPGSVGKKAPGEELPVAGDVDFSRPEGKKFGRRDAR